MCKSRGARCIEQGTEDPSSSETKPNSLRKHHDNERRSKIRAGTAIDQPDNLFEDAEPSDLILSEKIDSAPIVSLLIDAKVNSCLENRCLFFPWSLTVIYSFLN